ncbi:MAG TPA: hypothetical protein VFQ53_43340 [Kofleriaceae bacterium]|nr:hypothetical protein [Kofleriaceae bacterium]
MRWLGILAILGYRLCVRPFLRRRCLHDESCSAHAIRLLRTRGIAALPAIRARVRACRLPVTACFILDADGTAHLLAVSTRDGSPPPPRALAILADQARAGGR